MTVVCATNEGLYARCRRAPVGRIKFDFIQSETGIVAVTTKGQIL